MRPVTVFHLVNVLDIGGMEAGVIKLLNGIDRRVVKGGICSFRPAEAFRRRLTDGTPVFEFCKRDGNDPRLVGALYKLFRRERPDVVHTHGWGTLCEGVIAARLAGVPHVVHGEHGTMETRRHNLAVQRTVWRRVDRLLAVSERLADRMSELARVPRQRIQVIRNGVDLDRFAPRDGQPLRHSLGVAPDELLIVAVGRLVAVKDHAMLLRAVARVRSSGVRCRLWIAGDGPLRTALTEDCRTLGIEDVIALLGARDDIADLLAASDLFVLSSRSEGMSNTLLEAMAAGRPVVATRVGGNSEVVDDGVTGLLTDAEHAEAFAAAILELAADRPRLHAMGTAGRRRVEQEFSLEAMLQTYRAMYQDVVAGRLLVTASREMAG